MSKKQDSLYRVVILDTTKIDPTTGKPKIVHQEPATDASSHELLKAWAKEQNATFVSLRKPLRAEVRTAGKAMKPEEITL